VEFAEPTRQPTLQTFTNWDLVPGRPVKITIEPKGTPCIYVDGEVACPAKLEIDEPATIDQAIGRVGGMTDWASKRRVVVTHPDGKKVTVRRQDFGTFLLNDQDCLYVVRAEW
jgi:protein involved in polysaccharide export with SLBB domain